MSMTSFGGWKKISEEHFAEGGVLDKMYGSR
jgi:sulfate transport system substrate-binding protein